MPVSLQLRHRFDSLARAPAVETPMLALVAALDSIIAPRHARWLYDAWRGPKQWIEIGTANHNSISDDALYWGAIAAFLAVGPQWSSLGRNDTPDACFRSHTASTKLGTNYVLDFCEAGCSRTSRPLLRPLYFPYKIAP